jgi:hypothetical protein
MSKRNSKSDQPKKEKRATFVNSEGVTVHLKSIPPLTIPRISESVTFPEKPIYTITTASGDVEVHTHDETTLTTEEDKKAWEKYLLDNQEAEQELTQKILRAILIQGVVVDPAVLETEEFQNWKMEQELMGIPVSDNKASMLLQYKETFLAYDQEDIQSIMSLVMELTGVDEKELALAKASFQDSVES